MTEYQVKMLLGFLLWPFGMVIVYQVGEYWIHRIFMHKEFKLNPNKFAKCHLNHHTGVDSPLKHHIDLRFIDVLYPAVVVAPIVLFSAVVLGRPYAWGCLFWLFVFVRLHSYTYTKIHRRTHHCELSNWTDRIPWVERLHEHHRGHHKTGGSKNFGVTCTWTDKLFGTYWKPDK